ncbi:MAG: glycosyltransferase family 39 protein [Anaerolineae bacterium]|nr:glycosyltransferase family 39 protein [Anaerolineae bacterium]
MIASPAHLPGPRAHTRRMVQIVLPALLILLLAAAARIHGTAQRPAWTDEGWSAWAARDHRVEVVVDKLAQDRHPPLYFLSLSGWWSVAGPSRVALRWLSVGAGLLTVAAAYRVGADWFGHRSARYGALLLAVLDLAIYYSQEIRHYGFLMLAVCLMTLFFLRYLRRPCRSVWIAYTLSIAFMLYSLYLGLLVLAVQGIVGLLIWQGTRRQKAGLIAAWTGAAVLYLPWLIVIITEQWDTLTEGIGGFPGSYDTTLANLLPVSELVFGAQVALTAGLYALGVWHIARQRERSMARLARGYVVLAGIGLLVFMLVANLEFGMLSARTLVFLTPALMLVCGVGLAALDRRTAAVFALALVIVLLAREDVIQPRLESDRAADAVAAGYSPGDLVLLEAGWDDNAFLYELSLALPDGARIVRTLPWVDHTRPTQPVLPHIRPLLVDYHRVWVVQWLQAPLITDTLDGGEMGYLRALSDRTPIGEQYADLYPDDPTVQISLFERPDTAGDPLVYGDLLALHDTLLAPTLAAGDPLHVDLWWAALEPLPLDYSVGVFVLDANGAVVAEHNGPPGAVPTSQWVVGDLMFDRHTLALPADLPPGDYHVAVNAYWYGDLQPLVVNGEPLAEIGRVTVE